MAAVTRAPDGLGAAASAAPALDADGVRRRTDELVQRFDTALRSAGIRSDEPLGPVLEAWKQGMAWQGELTARTAQATVDVQGNLDQFIAGLAATPVMTANGEKLLIQRVSEHADSAVARNILHIAKDVRKRAVVSVAGAAAVALLVTAGGAWWWGRSSASTSVFIAPSTLVASCKGDAIQIIDGSPLCGVWVRMDEVTAHAPGAVDRRR